MKPLVDLLRDVLEQRLDQLNAHGLMLRLAHVWHRDVQASGLGTIIGSVAPEVQARWPLLSAWRWLVPTLDREVILSADTGGHSAAAVCAEGECDLARRGVLPDLVVPSSRQLGARLCRMMPCLTQVKALRTF